MKKITVTLTIIIMMLLVVGYQLQAQDLQEQVKKLGRDAAIGYVSPILSGWGNDLNSAIYYSADLHDVLGFDIGVKVALSRFKDEDKVYQLTLPPVIGVKASTLGYSVPGDPVINFVAGVDYDQVITANSAVGPKDNTPIRLKGNKTVSIPGYGTTTIPINRTLLELPGGFDIGNIGVPLLMPQLGVGLPLGFEVMLRYVPTVSAGDAGKFNYIGFGVRYDVDQWLPVSPVDIAVHFMTQKMNFKSKSDNDIFSANATAFGAEVSKKLFILTLYGGFQIESSKLTFADFTGYDPITAQNIVYPGFEVEGSNKSRFTVGARLLLLLINVHVEYSIAKNPVLAAGVGISIR